MARKRKPLQKRSEVSASQAHPISPPEAPSQLSNNTTALPGQRSSASMVIDQNEVYANESNEVLNGNVLQADTIIKSSKRLQDDLQSLGLKIKQHEDNIKSLKAQKNMFDDSILDKEVILGKYHPSASPSTKDDSFSSGGEKITTEQILKHDKSAAGILCQLKTHHGPQARILDLSKDVIGVVATLGKVDDENLSRLFSEYLGVEAMLTIVCKTQEGVKALETYDKQGWIDKNAGLHGLGSSIGRTLDGRFPVICLEDIRPYVGDFIAKDPQRRLDLIKPRLPNGECPPGFLGFAVNMVSMDRTHIFCLTSSGYGLRETLFYHLFSRTQVYSTRMDMLRALPLISGGAISLDGGMIRGPGIYYLGNWEDVNVRFPVTSDASSLPVNYRKLENQMEDLERKRGKLLEDLQREQQTMDQMKLIFERKKQELVVFLVQSSSCVTQIDDTIELECFSRFADNRANSLRGTLTILPDGAFSSSRPQSKRPRPPRTSLVASNEELRPAEAKGSRGRERQRCVHCASEKTPRWRAGPMGPGTLCNACGLRYRSGRLVPEHRPAVSRTFWLTQRTNSHGEAALSGSRLPNKRSRLSRTSSAALICNNSPASKGAGPVDAKGGRRGARRQCTHCAPEKTPQWRVGPLGPQTLCKACRVRYKSGQPVPEYGPAANPTFLLTQHSNSHKRAAISCSRSKNKRLMPPRTSLVASNEVLRPTEAKGSRARAKARQRCVQCASEKTPQWRAGPMGPGTLCNACGMQYRLRRLVPEYKPAASPTFVSTQHSNSHQKVMELRRQKAGQRQQNHRQEG